MSIMMIFATYNTLLTIPVGLALSEQVLPHSEKVPVSPHDHVVDMVVTGQGKILDRGSQTTAE